MIFTSQHSQGNSLAFFILPEPSLLVCLLQKEHVPDDYSRRDPEHKTIYRFIRTLFHAAQLTAECAIVTLVYIAYIINC